MNEYTELTQAMYTQARSSSLSPEDAVDWLLRERNFRTLPQKLLKYFGGDAAGMQAALREGLYALHPSPAERESIRKTVKNWCAEVEGVDDRSISRAYAVELCFVLGLSLERADDFLRAVTGEGIHDRDLSEFVLAFALKQGMTCARYRALLGGILPEQAAQDEPAGTQTAYTPESRKAVLALENEEELRAYVRAHIRQFGQARNTAYECFTGMMEALQEGDENIPVEELVARNLYRRFVQKNGRLTKAERAIRAGWPEETLLSKMKTREIPVSRKTLILLFLASGGGIKTGLSDDEYMSLRRDDEWPDEWLDAPDADFETLFVQLCDMLVQCGFAPIDPRAPFDWLVLFCMATGDLLDVDERFERVLTGLYGG